MHRQGAPYPASLKVVLIAVNAAAYAAVGYLTFLGIFAIPLGVVRFWPAVIVPGVFAALFGPMVGGVGAAIGIFISDMVIHGNPLLSLIAGVPSNFMGFYLIGYISNRKLGLPAIIVGGALVVGGALTGLSLGQQGLLSSDPDQSVLIGQMFFLSALIFAAASVILSLAYKKWRSYMMAAAVGLGLGSLWIGVTVWAFSQFFALPMASGGGYQLPAWAAAMWFIWTFATEYPFLVVVVPPIAYAARKALPDLLPETS